MLPCQWSCVSVLLGEWAPWGEPRHLPQELPEATATAVQPRHTGLASGWENHRFPGEARWPNQCNSHLPMGGLASSALSNYPTSLQKSHLVKT